MEMNSVQKSKSLQLYTNMKFEIEKLIDSILAPINLVSDEDIVFSHDIYIEDNFLVIEVEMPGVEKESVTVECSDRFIEIYGIKNTIKKRYKSCVALERTAGRFKKIIYLEKAVNMNKPDALLESGILRISFPLIEEKRGSKTIELR